MTKTKHTWIVFKRFLKELTNLRSRTSVFFRTILVYVGLTWLSIVNAMQKDEIRKLTMTVSDLKIEMAEYRIENKNLQLRESAMLTAINDLPIPVWTKEKKPQGYIMRYLNKSYADEFLAPRGFSYWDYIGETDYAVWDDDTAKAFQRNDSITARYGIPYLFTEFIPDSLGVRHNWLIGKYPQVLNDSVQFISGIAIQRQ